MITRARHRWPEAAGFELTRPTGMPEYIFIHVFNAVEIELKGERIPVRPGGCICYNIGTPQYLYSAAPLLHDWMHLSAEAGPLLREFGVPLDTVVYPEDTSFLTAGICDIELEINSERPFRDRLADAMGEMLLIRFARASTEGGEGSPVNPELRQRLYALRAELFAHLERNWTIEQMAAQLHLSPSRFFAVYKALFGTSPANDLIHARIDAARTALAGTGLSVTRLAEQLGYANVTHFSRQFRQQTGISPRAYRATRQTETKG